MTDDRLPSWSDTERKRFYQADQDFLDAWNRKKKTLRKLDKRLLEHFNRQANVEQWVRLNAGSFESWLLQVAQRANANKKQNNGVVS